MPRAFRVPAVLTALSLVGWMASARAMEGSSMGMAASMGSFLWLWMAMSAAMMLPSLVPAASLASAVGRSSAAFVGGYFAVWVASGFGAFEATRGLEDAGKWLAGAALVAAAVYQLTPLKDACLRGCRGPLGTLTRRSAAPAGVEHGLVCLGCCWALMLAMLALGAGSLFWMALAAGSIFVEKVTSFGARASTPIALALLGLAAWSVT